MTPTKLRPDQATPTRLPLDDELKQFQKTIYSESCGANQLPQRSCRKFLVLRNREIGRHPRLSHQHMTSHLSPSHPTVFRKCPHSLLAGDIPERSHYTATSIWRASLGMASRAF